MIPKKSYISGKGEFQELYNYNIKSNAEKITKPNVVIFQFINNVYNDFHKNKALQFYSIQDITSFLDNYEEYKFYQETTAYKFYTQSEVSKIGKNHKTIMNNIFDFLKDLEPIITKFNNSAELLSTPTIIAEMCDGNRHYIRNHRKIMSMIYTFFEIKISEALDSIKSNSEMRIDLSKINVTKQRSLSPLKTQHSTHDFIMYRNGFRRKSTPMILGATFKNEVINTPRST